MSITSATVYGFTLLEMIVSLGIVMLLAAFAVPSFMPLRDQAAMEHLAIEFRGEIMNARHSAVRLNTDVYVHAINLTSTPTQTDNWCLVVSTSATENDCDGSNETLSMLQSPFPRLSDCGVFPVFIAAVNMLICSRNIPGVSMNTVSTY